MVYESSDTTPRTMPEMQASLCKLLETHDAAKLAHDIGESEEWVIAMANGDGELSLMAQARLHHDQQFGDVDIFRILTKLNEEVGELCAEVTRVKENRGSHDRVLSEFQDVLVVINILSSRFGVDLALANQVAIERFLERQWDINPLKTFVVALQNNMEGKLYLEVIRSTSWRCAIEEHSQIDYEIEGETMDEVEEFFFNTDCSIAVTEL